MTKNEIKKDLYKQNPTAVFTHIRKNVAFYKTKLENDAEVLFEIPVVDMGDADFFQEMEGKYIIKWIAINE